MSDKRRVLIVDDEPDLLLMLQMRLSATGLFEVATASGGEEALETAKSFRPDIVLVDKVMPSMDGLEVCRRLRQPAEGKVPAVVLMTAGTPVHSERQAKEEHLDGLIFKPYDPAQVVKTLKTLVPAGG